jgi:hypothetical protein
MHTICAMPSSAVMKSQHIGEAQFNQVWHSNGITRNLFMTFPCQATSQISWTSSKMMPQNIHNTHLQSMSPLSMALTLSTQPGTRHHSHLPSNAPTSKRSLDQFCNMTELYIPLLLCPSMTSPQIKPRQHKIHKRRQISYWTTLQCILTPHSDIKSQIWSYTSTVMHIICQLLMHSAGGYKPSHAAIR